MKVDILGMQKRKPIITFTNTLGQILILGLVILFLVNIGRSIWKNHQTTLIITNLETDINTLKNEQLNLQNRIIYYNTDTYKELEARRHLGYKKRDENVVALIKKNENIIDLNTDQNLIDKSKTNSKTDNLPNWQKWIKYIFS